METIKLLPSSKKINTSSFLGKEKKETGGIHISSENLNVISTKVITIEKLLEGQNKLLKSKTTKVKKEEETKKRSKKEEELEKPKDKEEKDGRKLLKGPKLGFLDRIKNFLGKMILGFIAVRLIPYLPHLLKIVPKIAAVNEFFIDTGIGLIDGFATFVDGAYELRDKTLGFIKGIGGDFAVDMFKNFEGVIGKVLEAAIIVAMSAGGEGGLLDTGGELISDFFKKRGAQQLAQRGAQAAATQAGGAATQAGGIGAGAVAGIVAGAGLLASALGEGAFQLRKIATKPIQDKQKEFDKLGWFDPRKYFVGAQLGGMKMLLGPLSAIGVMLDIVGAPFRYAIELLRYPFLSEEDKKKQANNLAKFDARIREDFRKGMNMLTLGFAFKEKGSFGNIYGNTGAQKEMMSKMAGGGITRGGRRIGGSIKRGVKKTTTRREVKVEPTKLKPGSSVGGVNKVETAVPVNYSEKFYDTTSDIPFFGPIFSLATKAYVGDKPNQVDYKNAGSALNSWINTTFSSDTLRGGMAFAGGGEVNAEMLMKGDDLTNVIAKSLEDNISKKITDALNDLQKQMKIGGMEGKKDKDEGDKQGDDPNLDVGDGGTVTGGNADFWTLVAIASLESGTPQGRADVAQSIYNRLSSGIYSGNTIKELIVSGNGRQYQPVGRAVREFRSISDKESAINAVMVANKLTRSQAEKFINDSASAIQNKELQASAAQFVGGRTDFWAQGLNPPSNGVGYVVRHGHRFGWFVGPAAIAYGKKNPGPAKAPALGDIVVMGGAAGKGGMLGSGKFIQGNSGASAGVHFHIGPGSQVKGTILQRQYFADARASAKQAIDFFLSKGSRVYDGRRGTYYKSGNEVGAAQAAHTGSGSAGGIDMQVDFEKPVPFPLKTTGMAYRRNGFGVSADISGSNSFVAHGRYDEKGNVAPQERMKLYAKGGLVRGFTKAILGERGIEFVLDNDTTVALQKTFPGFLDALNRANFNDAVTVLRNYASYEVGAMQEVQINNNIINVMAQDSAPQTIMIGGDGGMDDFAESMAAGQ